MDDPFSNISELTSDPLSKEINPGLGKTVPVLIISLLIGFLVLMASISQSGTKEQPGTSRAGQQAQQQLSATFNGYTTNTRLVGEGTISKTPVRNTETVYVNRANTLATPGTVEMVSSDGNHTCWALLSVNSAQGTDRSNWRVAPTAAQTLPSGISYTHWASTSGVCGATPNAHLRWQSAAPNTS